MAKIKVFTDSAADIPKQLADELDITVIPIKLHMDGETYIDGVTLKAEDFYNRLPDASDFPTTSQPSPMDFCDAYRKVLEQDTDVEVLSIHLSSALSGTYQSAVLAKSMLEEDGLDVTIMDSQSATYGLGMVVVAAARAAKEGKSLNECIKVAQYYIDHQKIIFTVDTLEYIQKGGRIGKAAALVGTLLNIIPILSLNEQGEVISVDKVRGKGKVLQRVIELMQQNVAVGPVSVGVLHGNNEPGANRWLDKLKELYDVKECVITCLGPSIGTHAGPGAIAAVLVPLGGL